MAVKLDTKTDSNEPILLTTGEGLYSVPDLVLNAESNLKGYLNSRNWSVKKKKAFVEAYNLIIDRLNNQKISEIQPGGLYIDLTGTLSNKKHGFDAVGAVGYYLDTIREGMSTYNKPVEEEPVKASFVSHLSDLSNLIANTVLPGTTLDSWGSDDTLGIWNSYGNEKRKQVIKDAITNHRKEVAESDYDWKDSNYLSKEDYLGRLDSLLSAISNNTIDDEDKQRLAALGLPTWLLTGKKTDAQIAQDLIEKARQEQVAESVRPKTELELKQAFFARRLSEDDSLDADRLNAEWEEEKIKRAKENADYMRNYAWNNYYNTTYGTPYNGTLLLIALLNSINAGAYNYANFNNTWATLDQSLKKALTDKFESFIKAPSQSNFDNDIRALLYLSKGTSVMPETKTSGVYLIVPSIDYKTGVAWYYDARLGAKGKLYQNRVSKSDIKESLIAKHLYENWRTNIYKKAKGGVLRFDLGGNFIMELDKRNADYLKLRADKEKAVQQERDSAIKAEQLATALAAKQQAVARGRDPKRYDAGQRTQLSGSDYAYLAGISADLTGAITSLAGAPVAGGVIGLGGTVGSFIGDWNNDAVSAGEMWGNAALGVGLDLIGMIPEIGGASEGVKAAMKLVKFTPHLVNLVSTAYNAPEYVKSVLKLVKKDWSSMTIDDIRNYATLTQALAGGVNMAAHKANRARYRSNLTESGKVKVKMKDGTEVLMDKTSAEQIHQAGIRGGLTEAQTVASLKLLELQKQRYAQDLTAKRKRWELEHPGEAVPEDRFKTTWEGNSIPAGYEVGEIAMDYKKGGSGWRRYNLTSLSYTPEMVPTARSHRKRIAQTAESPRNTPFARPGEPVKTPSWGSNVFDFYGRVNTHSIDARLARATWDPRVSNPLSWLDLPKFGEARAQAQHAERLKARKTAKASGETVTTPHLERLAAKQEKLAKEAKKNEPSKFRKWINELLEDDDVVSSSPKEKKSATLPSEEVALGGVSVGEPSGTVVIGSDEAMVKHGASKSSSKQAKDTLKKIRLAAGLSHNIKDMPEDVRAEVVKSGTEISAREATKIDKNIDTVSSSKYYKVDVKKGKKTVSKVVYYQKGAKFDKLRSFLAGGSPGNSGIRWKAGAGSWYNDVYLANKKLIFDKLKRDGYWETLNLYQDVIKDITNKAKAQGDFTVNSYNGDDVKLYLTWFNNEQYNTGIDSHYGTRYERLGTGAGTSDNKQGKYNPDGRFSAITHDRTTLGRKEDWEANPNELEAEKKAYLEAGYEMYLDPDGYYKLKPVDTRATTSNEVGTTPGASGAPGAPVQRGLISPVGSLFIGVNGDPKKKEIFSKLGELKGIGLDALALGMNLWGNKAIHDKVKEGISAAQETPEDYYHYIDGLYLKRMGAYDQASNTESLGRRTADNYTDVNNSLASLYTANQLAGEQRFQGDVLDAEGIEEDKKLLEQYHIQQYKDNLAKFDKNVLSRQAAKALGKKLDAELLSQNLNDITKAVDQRRAESKQHNVDANNFLDDLDRSRLERSIELNPEYATALAKYNAIVTQTNSSDPKVREAALALLLQVTSDLQSAYNKAYLVELDKVLLSYAQRHNFPYVSMETWKPSINKNGGKLSNDTELVKARIKARIEDNKLFGLGIRHKDRMRLHKLNNDAKAKLLLLKKAMNL